MSQSALASLPEALDWLRDVAGELADVPTRLHEHAVQPADLLGAPRMSAGFLHHLTDGPYATRLARRPVRCPGEHPIRAVGEPRCPMCEDAREWQGGTDTLAYPLRAALSTLSRAHSRLKPHPRHVVGALLREGCNPVGAALRLPGYAADDSRFLSALRALHGSYSYTPLGALPRRAVA